MSASDLPPLRNLPCWSRVRDLDRVRYPRLLSSDWTPRSPPVISRSPQEAAQPRMDANVMRIASLEKDIMFLQEQHKDTLERLHSEIEDLKRINKELQYQLVMDHQYSPKGSRWSNSNSSSSSDSSPDKNSQCGFISSEEVSEASVGPSGGAVSSLIPLRITCSPSQCPRAPTLKECEVIIRELHHVYTSQCQELLQIKTILKDIVLNKNKSSTKSVSLARACLFDNTKSDVFKHFPQLPLKPLPNKQHLSQTSRRESVILPAIKCNLSSTMSERQRRAQDIHKMRLRRAVNS